MASAMAVRHERNSPVIRAARQLTGAHMKDQSTTDYQAVRVRPLEPRDFTDALQMFPGAILRLHPVLSAAAAEPGFLQEIVSARQSAWVAEAEGRLIGMAVLSIESKTVARLRYLNVAGDGPHHAPAARALADIAIRNAWDGGFLKLVVHTHIPASHVIEYMHELGFEFARTHSSGSERVVEFYRNPYEPPKDPSSEVGNITEFSRERSHD